MKQFSNAQKALSLTVLKSAVEGVPQSTESEVARSAGITAVNIFEVIRLCHPHPAFGH
jgi:hypothetical protein